MPDPRFFQTLAPLTMVQAAALAGCPAPLGAGGERLIRAVAPLATAGVGDLAFLSARRYLADLATTRAGVVILSAEDAAAAPAGAVVLVSPTPQAAWARVAGGLHPVRDPHGPGEPARLEADVRLGDGVRLGVDVRIGEGTVVGANTVIGHGVQIGRGCRIGANVTLGFALIGDRVRILSGAVVGEDGFGVTGDAQGLVDLPQLGRVIIQDAVSIGANSCVDRGAYDDTVIGENSKIDNLVQIAHNVRIGRNCVLAAHTGLSGSVTVGDGAMFGGRAGVHDHVSVGAGAKIAAASAVTRDVPAGERWGGQPAQLLRRHQRETVWLRRRAAEGRGEA